MAKEPQVITQYRSLAMRVLVVARWDVDVGDWAAYADAVPGERHDLEWQPVLNHGDKVSEEVAKALFAGELESINEQLKERGDDEMIYRH